MELPEIVAPVAADMAAVDRLIVARLRSEVALIDRLSAHIVHSGGKRLRPLVVLLAARACGHRGDAHVQLAAVVEFIHTATLLHDDVVDGSELRRGRRTANAVWGNAASVLVGDFLYSRAFQMMVEVRRPAVLRVMADATNAIAEGEVMQLLNVRNPQTTEAQYMDVIRRKTATLFEAGARIGALLAGATRRVERALADYGRHLGCAFQLIDDVLDFEADPQTTGKNLGDDLAEGKPTLPLIYAMEHGPEEDAAYLRHAIEQGGRDWVPGVLEAVTAAGALDYTRAVARREAQQAEARLAALPPSPYRDSLAALARFAVERRY